MKFCPICGSPYNGSDFCPNCGTKKGEKEAKPIEKKRTEKIMHVVPLKELKSKKYDTGEIESITFSSGGGMGGGSSNISLNFQMKTIESSQQSNWNSPRKVVTYQVEDELLDKIRKNVEENNYAAWSEVGDDERFRAFDAPTGNNYFRYKECSYHFSDLMFQDEEEKKVFGELVQLIHSGMTVDKILKQEEIPNQTVVSNGFFGMGMMGMSPVPAPSPSTSKPSKRFCPECGSVFEEGEFTCKACGYTIPEEARNS